jgi:hypothetical protein
MVDQIPTTDIGCPRNKQIFFLGSNRNKPKHNLFRFIFGLFRETKKYFFRVVSVFRSRFETTETNRFVSKQTETNRNNPKKWNEPNKTAMKKCMISRVGRFLTFIRFESKVTGYVLTKVRKTAKNVFESIGLYRGKITLYTGNGSIFV